MEVFQVKLIFESSSISNPSDCSWGFSGANEKCKNLKRKRKKWADRERLNVEFAIKYTIDQINIHHITSIISNKTQFILSTKQTSILFSFRFIQFSFSSVILLSLSPSAVAVDAAAADSSVFFLSHALVLCVSVCFFMTEARAFNSVPLSHYIFCISNTQHQNKMR